MDGSLKNVLFIATGALLSPVSTQQGESIPSIAHAISITTSLQQ
ncbi:stage V sporulation protein AD [Acetivibrio straminisolvens JCM 21531]|uniref:Stage V sporulation protein AD n=2 Tax=Acetivibrio straminisolvens TaxID=253314 RepID=W4V3V2_9FIRM|nr:stage V sporulation protein AD [Acetivibrio straminisolvens JCM 21531]